MTLDESRNAGGTGGRDISAPGAPVRTLVSEARKDIEIACRARAVLGGPGTAPGDLVITAQPHDILTSSPGKSIFRANRLHQGRLEEMKTHRKVALAVFAIALVLGVAAPASAVTLAGAPQRAAAHSPLPTGGPSARAFVNSVGARIIRNQDALSVFRSWMIAQPGFARSGYVGAIDDLAHKATTIMWYGPRTPLLKAILKEGERRGIAVSVQPRQHSLRQIDAAVNAIWRQAARGKWTGFKISDIAGVAARDNGITVNGTYTAAPAAQRAPQVRSLATVVRGVPVHVVPGVSVVAATGRDNDFAPFDAGGYMLSPSTGTTCSSGFAIVRGGATHTTTARHCNKNDYQDRAASNRYGTGVANSSDGGGRELSATGAALALDGPFNSNNFSKTVIGYEDLAVGNFVCTGGGNSGEHCNIKVTNLRVSFNDGFGTFSTIEGTQQSSGAIAAIQGDSGGPVISLANTQSGQVRAAGMIQGIESPFMTGSACGPVFDAGSNLCSKKVLFSSMRTIVNNLSGASLLTG